MGVFKTSRSVVYRVPEMNCGHCETKVAAAVKTLASVTDVKATSADKRLEIVFNGEVGPSVDAVNAVLEPAGYRAESSD